MLAGALLVECDDVVRPGRRALHVLRAARADPLFYLGVILFAVGALW